MVRPSALVLAGVLLAGCSPGAGDPPAAAPTSAEPVQTDAAVPTCPPVPPRPGFAWPRPVPSDLPMPPGGTLTETRTTADGLTLVQFSTRSSLRDGVVFLVERLAPAGYTLGRGDAEATEADAPFAKADLRGVFRMISRSECRTDWLLAVTRQVAAGSGSPLLPARPGAGSPSPLPFG